ncbi:glycosyltransferase family 2 protein [Clostridium butyricum]|uniref:glycosyltransferase family 2 protein n=1 Tax=Clostridium butyricum TaxID=1492 RepID=UPI002ABD1D92|nr:glycosyltransferase family 2 protein [Clostridium butyricum]
MNEPLISVILPIYNIEKYLPTCMEALFNQTYKNLEFILIDDGSRKECSNLCDSYLDIDKRVVVYHKENGGLSDARNYGIKRSNGEYITCIDPDDYVDFDYVEYLFTVLNKYRCKMSICQHRIKYDNGSIKDNGRKQDEDIGTKLCIERMLYHDVIDTSAWGKLYHRSLFDKIEYPKGKLFEDIGTTYALMMKCEKIAVGYESKYNYIFHNNSIVNGEFKPNKLDMLEMTDKMATDVIDRYPELWKGVQRRQVYARFSTLNQMLNVVGYDKERQEILDYIKKYKKAIMFNSQNPKRDKIAFIILTFSYKLYRFCWLKYENYIMGGKN